MKKILLTVSKMRYFPLFGAFFLVIAGNAYGGNPWWTLDYESTESRIEKETTYDENGRPVTREILNKEGTITFLEPEEWTVDSLSDTERNIYDEVVKIKNSEPGASSPAIARKLREAFGRQAEEDIANALGFFHYDTASGPYEYLREKPNKTVIRLYDTWFTIFESQYPHPPATLEGFLRIEANILTLLSDQFNLSPRRIQETIARMEVYKEKHGISADQKLGDAL